MWDQHLCSDGFVFSDKNNCLAIYSDKILLVFLIGSALYILWVLLFMKKRREVDYKRFAQMADNQSNLIQLITGMQEIKLNNCERQKRWDCRPWYESAPQPLPASTRPGWEWDRDIP